MNGPPVQGTYRLGPRSFANSSRRVPATRGRGQRDCGAMRHDQTRFQSAPLRKQRRWQTSQWDLDTHDPQNAASFSGPVPHAPTTPGPPLVPGAAARTRAGRPPPLRAAGPCASNSSTHLRVLFAATCAVRPAPVPRSVARPSTGLLRPVLGRHRCVLLAEHHRSPGWPRRCPAPARNCESPLR